MPLKCIAIDDERPALMVLEKFIGQTPELEWVASFQKPLEGLQFLRSNAVDLLFLDINMPDLSGIGLVQSLPEKVPVIFTTAYPEYAVEGFELQAVDYLLKPFSFERFLKAVNRAISLTDRIEKVEPSLQNTLIIRADRKIHRLLQKDILYLEAFGDYVKVHTQQDCLLPKERLSHLEEKLDPHLFFRIHRTFIVNLNAINYLEGNSLVIKETRIPVSKSYRKALLEKIGLEE
jgi:DNA-binding LytR/AlgR family response regulator